MNVTLGNILGLNAQSQLLLPLTHIASILKGNHRSPNKNLINIKSHSKFVESHQNDNTNVLYAESFESACKSVSEIFKDVNLRDDFIENFNIYIDTKLCKNCFFRKPLPWMRSHSSGWTFDYNKYRNLSQNICLNPILSHDISLLHFNHSHSVRYMSTHSRPTQSLGMGQHNRGTVNPKSDTGLGLTLGSIANDPKGNRKLREKIVSRDGNEKLKSLLNEENLEPHDKEKIKIAFAEGYLAAEPKSRVSSKMRIFNLFRDLMGIILILAILFSFMGEMSGGSFRRVLIGHNSEVHPEEIDVTFEDVKGVEEAKQELQEVVEFLKNPEKFSSLGGKLPKGVLLVGPPGTGKTLLARAVAGEAGVPFFHAAGPEFDEILVGQGARRVRDLFNTAKLRAPCVVFIDEIDSVGAKRTNSVLHPYANQTINQLLTEMDGFRQNEGVIVLGATNRRGDLDRALLRPGRFDVEVIVPIPDYNGRKEIFDLYLGKVKLDDDVNVDVLARNTTGFTGADIENVVNQAALRAAIEGAHSVSMKYLESSRDKVLMGPERKSRIPDAEANYITAFHEGGHAIVAHFTKDAHPIHKVTIVPRGPSLGHTAFIPEKERYHETKSQMLAQIDTSMGGRAAEELIFGSEKITTGAADDLKKATAIATLMVKNWGMSDKIGVRTFENEHNSLVVVNELAATTAECIDSEIKKILQDSYDRAKNILKIHSREHRDLAEALIKYETLDAEEVKNIIAGRDAR